ncbi:MAG TPA: ATP-binding protein [Candidatus Krumholzibacteria bacterium]|nr:ATP-binding protein [Candidatus Krumholzibacteria bacterium]HRX49978.1 ATP-binding protein [Candidatus Krumholzibacteria bacterium]
MRWLVILSSVVVLVVILRHYLGLHRSRSRVVHQLTRSRTRLAKAEKLASLGAVSAGIAHELSTPLGAVRCTVGNQRLTREKLLAHLRETHPGLEQDPTVTRCLTMLAEGDRVLDTGMEQVAALLQEMRAYATQEAAAPEPVDLHERIDGALVLVHNLLKRSVEVRREYGDLPPVPVHPARFTQILLNLLVNAARAMPDGGVITVRTTREGDHVTVSVADTGVGIPPENLDRIFQFGFTTHGESGGTGLGLPITRDLVEGHGGAIAVRSEPGRGSEFVVTLPLTPPPVCCLEPQPWNDDA